MDLIERYVAAVSRHAPAKQAGDIRSELRDELLSRVEERETALGRPLTRPETEALLREFGHPLVVAGRYRKTQQLIGPQVFPFWLIAAQWSLGILLLVNVVLIAIGVLTNQPTVDIQRAIPSMVTMAIFIFGAITLAFAAFERFGKTGFLTDWKPSRLPAPQDGARPRATLVVEILMEAIFIAWWLGAIRFQQFFPYPGHLKVTMAPVWAAWFWPILAYAGVEIAANVVALARPAWAKTNQVVFALRYLFGVVILAGVFQAGHWLDVSSPVIPPHALATIQANFDLGMKAGIGIAILGMLARVGVDLWRLRRGGEPRGAAHA